jgi:hypothetical protein
MEKFGMMTNTYYESPVDSGFFVRFVHVSISTHPVLFIILYILSTHPVHIMPRDTSHIMPSFSGTSYESIGEPRRKRTHKVSGMNHASVPRLGPSTQDHFLAAAVARSVEHLPTSSPTMASTPLLQQLGQTPGNRVHSTLIGSHLATELQGNIARATDAFIERLFPEERLPFSIDDRTFKALATANCWDLSGNTFTGQAYTESGLANWLNRVGNVMAGVDSQTLDNDRQWWHGSHQRPPTGAYANRKPDLVLLDRGIHQSLAGQSGHVDWLHIRSFAEVTQELSTPSRIPSTINAKSYLQFSVQHDRRFTIALFFNNSGQYGLTLTDREGQIQYNAGSLVGSGTESARLFLKILAFLMFGSDSDIGLDPHFIREPRTDALIGVNIDEERYDIIQHIYKLDNLLSRGTNVWIVSRDNVQYVLKDYWSHSEAESEVTALRLMMGHDEIESLVPTYIRGGDVFIGGERDSTYIYRGEYFLGRPRNRRVHRRLLSRPIGKPLTTFRSKKEFIKAMQTVVTGTYLN